MFKNISNKIFADKIDFQVEYKVFFFIGVYKNVCFP